MAGGVLVRSSRQRDGRTGATRRCIRQRAGVTDLAHEFEKRCEPERLFEHRVAGRSEVRRSGHDRDGDPFQAGRTAEVGKYARARDAGHHQIEQDRRWRLVLLEKPDCSCTILRRVYAKSLLLEQLAQRLAYIGVIIDNQERRRSGGSRLDGGHFGSKCNDRASSGRLTVSRGRFWATAVLVLGVRGAVSPMHLSVCVVTTPSAQRSYAFLCFTSSFR